MSNRSKLSKLLVYTLVFSLFSGSLFGISKNKGKKRTRRTHRQTISQEDRMINAEMIAWVQSRSVPGAAIRDKQGNLIPKPIALLRGLSHE